jgi:ankyrin repeat protein
LILYIYILTGWTPLHYAAESGNIAACKILLNNPLVNLQINSQPTGKGSTPLELVKVRLQNSTHFSSDHISNLQSIAKELSSAIRNQEKIRIQKQTERLEKEEKINQIKLKQIEKEEKEKELLIRKQKQLKEKQNRQRDFVEVEVKQKNITPTKSISSKLNSCFTYQLF